MGSALHANKWMQSAWREEAQHSENRAKGRISPFLFRHPFGTAPLANNAMLS
jgi:hypothetical protein